MRRICPQVSLPSHVSTPNSLSSSHSYLLSPSAAAAAVAATLETISLSSNQWRVVGYMDLFGLALAENLGLCVFEGKEGA